MTTTEKLNLSEKIDIFSNTLKGKYVKEFIRLLDNFMVARKMELSEFDGLGEVMLQKAEIENIRKELFKLAGDKLTK